MIRFLHSSDLHLGKRFGNLPEDLRGRLREARHTAIERLAGQARQHGAGIILLAGDTFDTETPAPYILRQALAAMGAHDDLRWIVLPGNHDSLLAEDLWQTVLKEKPANVDLTLAAEPLWLTPDAVVLPAPCTSRRPGRDVTLWMDGCDTGDAVRIGLAHGAIQTFSEDGNAADVIAPDRARHAGLDYLALGDWHGQLEINRRTWYSGTPEPDRFKHDRPGRALVVSIAAHGADPEVTPVDTGQFEWRTLALDLLSGDIPDQALAERLPAGTLRRQILLQVVATGHTSLPGRTALQATMTAVEPEFAHAVLLEDDLVTDCDSVDLDRIDLAGALRQAAESLLSQGADDSLAAEDRTVARDALVRLFTYCEAIKA